MIITPVFLKRFVGMFDIWHVMNKCTAVAKRELFYAWPFGLAAWLAGLIFIDRVKGERARKTLNTVSSRIKKDNIKLWVFPEGTRRNTGEVHPFKKGAFHLAIDEQIPILPVVFSSYCTFLNGKKKILNAGNIIVTTLPPIPTLGLTKSDLPELIDRVHYMMSDTFKQSSDEILQRYASQTMHNKKIQQRPKTFTNPSTLTLPLSNTASGVITTPTQINYQNTASCERYNTTSVSQRNSSDCIPPIETLPAMIRMPDDEQEIRTRSDTSIKVSTSLVH